MRKLVIVTVLGSVLWSSSASAQTFNSGSTGADGALDVSQLFCFVRPQDSLEVCEVILPPSGILNYTTVHVPVGKTITFRTNPQNTPVTLLAQGDVVIEGTISVDAWPFLPENRYDAAAPGPGGFPGGAPTAGQGLGPGGGTEGSVYGRWVGPLSLVPLVGGSGGASYYSPGGGQQTGLGGGGAIVIASSGVISVLGGRITANPYLKCGVLGSGGAVRLVANRIAMGGSINARGQWFCNYSYGTVPGAGIVRLEAPAGSLSYTGSSDPAPILATINPAITAPAAPGLRIVSIAGYLVPDSAGNRKDAADLVLPKQMADPINVLVEATNIPVGSPVTVSFGTSNTGTSTAGTLAGSLASSTATIPVSGLNRDQLAYLYVQVLFAPPALRAAAVNVPESSRVAQVRMTQAPGAKPRFAFLRGDGAEVPLDKVPPTLQAWVSESYLK